MPTHVARGLPYEKRSTDCTEDQKVKDLFLPDLVVGSRGLKGGCRLRGVRMGKRKFFDLAATLLQEAHNN